MHLKTHQHSLSYIVSLLRPEMMLTCAWSFSRYAVVMHSLCEYYDLYVETVLQSRTHIVLSVLLSWVRVSALVLYQINKKVLPSQTIGINLCAL